jgi:hypothetical protein
MMRRAGPASRPYVLAASGCGRCVLTPTPYSTLTGSCRRNRTHNDETTHDRHLTTTAPSGMTIVFAALAIARWIEDTTDWSTKRFVRTTRRYRTVQ